MNWIAERFSALVTKVDNACTEHSALAARVTELEKLLAEPPKVAEVTPAAGG